MTYHKPPRLSVVVPVFNTPPYLLGKLWASILEQAELSRVEVIIIDDGSTNPGTVDAITKLSQVALFQVFRQANSGVQAARIAGAEKASGSYIWFVDADDLLADGAFARILGVLESSPDILIFGHERLDRLDAVRSRVSPNSATIKMLDLAAQSDFVNHLIASDIFRELWNKVFRRDIATHARAGKRGYLLGEDQLMVLGAVALARSAKVTGDVNYRYRADVPGQATATPRREHLLELGEKCEELAHYDSYFSITKPLAPRSAVATGMKFFLSSFPPPRATRNFSTVLRRHRWDARLKLRFRAARFVLLTWCATWSA